MAKAVKIKFANSYCWTFGCAKQMDGYEATRLIRKWEREVCEECNKEKTVTGGTPPMSPPPSAALSQCPHRRVPIVAVTADVMKGTHEQCFDSGMDDYIPKVCVTKVTVILFLKFLKDQDVFMYEPSTSIEKSQLFGL